MYHLGSSQMFRCSGHARWSRYLKATVAVFWGQYGLPMPYKHDIISLVGKPIPGQDSMCTSPAPLILADAAHDGVFRFSVRVAWGHSMQNTHVSKG